MVLDSVKYEVHTGEAVYRIEFCDDIHYVKKITQIGKPEPVYRGSYEDCYAWLQGKVSDDADCDIIEPRKVG